MKLMKKLLMCLMAAALVCALATSALAASDTEGQDLLEILRQLYAAEAESSDTISFPALLASETDDDSDTDDSGSSDSSSSDSEIPETNVEGTASITFGEPTIENGIGTIDVYVTADSGVSGVQATVAYGSALTFSSAETTTAAFTSDYSKSSVTQGEGNTLSLVFADTQNYDAVDGLLLATLTFTVDTTAASGFDLTTTVDYVTNWTKSDGATAIGKYTTLEAGTATMLTFSLLDSTAANSADNPYIIDSVAKLELLRDNVNAGTTYEGVYFRQTVDLDLNSEAWTPIGFNDELKCGLTTGLERTISGVVYFAGVYDGNNYKITGLNVSETDLVKTTANNYAAVGLFGLVDGGTVENLTVSGSVTYTSTECPEVRSNICVGGIVGAIGTNGTVSNCTVENMTVKIVTNYSEEHNGASILFRSYTGGIVGLAYGTTAQTDKDYAIYITDCTVESTASITVSASNNYSTTIGNMFGHTGGIVGSADLCEIDGCVNNADVVGGLSVGGIVGRIDRQSKAANHSSVLNCANNGDITSSCTDGASLGGLVGMASYLAPVTNCINTGDVILVPGNSTYDAAGGLVGAITETWSIYGKITGCKNIGSVISKTDDGTADGYVGGLVGYTAPSNNGTYFSDCYNLGSLSGGSIIGGLVGYNTKKQEVINCYNAGTLASDNEEAVLGALIGSSDVAGTWTNCYYLSSACSEDTTSSTAVTWADMATLAEKLGDSWVTPEGTNTVTFSCGQSYVKVSINGTTVNGTSASIASPALSWETDTSANPEFIVFAVNASYNYVIASATVTVGGETLTADDNGYYSMSVSADATIAIEVEVTARTSKQMDDDIDSIIVSVAASTQAKSDDNSTYNETLDLNGDDKNDLLDILSILYIRQAEDAAASDDSSSDDTSSDTDTTTEETEETEETTETTVEATAETETAAAEAAETEETAEAA